MPILSTKAHAKNYTEALDLSQRLADIRLLLDSIRQMEIAEPLKKRMLVHGVWEVARASGNYYSRYRSERVRNTVGEPIQRDHIFKKRTLVEELLSPSPNLDKILDQAQCCIVTKNEHDKLHDIDNNLDGWDRYREAGILVYDMLHDKPLW